MTIIGIVRADRGGKQNSAAEEWWVVRNCPLAQSGLFQSILNSRFPKRSFEFVGFQLTALKKLAKNQEDKDPVGLLMDLKALKATQMVAFDFITKRLKSVYKILIVTPESYRLLNQKRKKVLQDCTLILSEQKSLDYLAQLPRLMDEASLRLNLKQKKKALEDLIQRKSMVSRLPLEAYVEIPDQLCSSPETKQTKGLKIKLKSFKRLRKSMGPTAAEELLDLMSRCVSRGVRSGDRVLKTNEDEFTVFLSEVSPAQLKKCASRIRNCLDEIELHQNKRPQDLQFQVRSVQRLPVAQ